jgi:exonuclease SbcC
LHITRVELKNIKRHAEEAFSFQPGVIAICGPNGSGKSTILEAIAWALFDQLDYKREDFLRRGAKKGQVTVGFQSDLDGREYLVTRDTSGGYFVYDPITQTRLVEQKSQVLPWLRQRLGVEPETDLATLFRSTLGVPQGAFTHDFGLAATQRKAVFDQILKVEEYRRASDQLRGTQRLVESRVGEAERQLAGYEGELRGWGGVIEGIARLEERLADLREQQAGAEAERERLREQVDFWGRARQQLDGQRRRVMEGQLALATHRESLGALEGLVREAREAAALVARTQAGAARYGEVTRTLVLLEARRKERDEQRALLAEEDRCRVEVEGELRRIEERLTEILTAKREVIRLEPGIEEQERVERALAEAREARGEGQGLQRAQEVLAEELRLLRSQYQELAHQIDQAMAGEQEVASLPVLEEARAALERQMRELELATERQHLKREERERLQEVHDRTRDEVERLREEWERLEVLSRVAEDLPAREERQRTLTQQVARMQAEIGRDLEMMRALEEGGICPLLTERCLNLRPGESLDHRLRQGIEVRIREVEVLEEELARAEEGLRGARLAAGEVVRLPQSQRAWREQRERLLILERQEQDLTQEILSLEDRFSTSLVGEQRVRLAELEKALQSARNAQRQLDQAEPLRKQQEQIAAEGERKRRAYDQAQERLMTLGDPAQRITELEAQLERLADPRGRAQALRRLIETVSDWEDRRERAASRARTLAATCEQLRNHLAEVASLDGEITDLTKERMRVEADHYARLANLPIAETLANREEDLRTLVENVTQLTVSQANEEARLVELEARYDEGAHQRDLVAHERCREGLVAIASQRVPLEDQLGRLLSERIRLETLQAQASELARQLASLQRLRDKTNLIRDLLVRVAPYITESYLYSISQEANLLYREITGCYDVTLNWNREYEITLEEAGWTRPFQTLSGGEQMAAALAVRLALLRELSDVRIAFFDEPTTNLDEERRRSLAIQLGRIHDFQQLFVISHDDSFEGLTDQQIHLGGSVTN